MKDAEEDDWEAAEQESPEAFSDTGWDDEVVEEVANGDWPALESTATELSDACAVRDRQPSYEILTEQELMQRQNILVERVVEQLFVSPEEATTLLRAYGWNILNLINDWLDDPDKARIWNLRRFYISPAIPTNTWCLGEN